MPTYPETPRHCDGARETCLVITPEKALCDIFATLTLNTLVPERAIVAAGHLSSTPDDFRVTHSRSVFFRIAACLGRRTCWLIPPITNTGPLADQLELLGPVGVHRNIWIVDRISRISWTSGPWAGVPVIGLEPEVFARIPRSQPRRCCGSRYTAPPLLRS